jgi:hypothetical protein
MDSVRSEGSVSGRSHAEGKNSSRLHVTVHGRNFDKGSPQTEPLVATLKKHFSSFGKVLDVFYRYCAPPPLPPPACLLARSALHFHPPPFSLPSAATRRTSAL